MSNCYAWFLFEITSCDFGNPDNQDFRCKVNDPLLIKRILRHVMSNCEIFQHITANFELSRICSLFSLTYHFEKCMKVFHKNKKGIIVLWQHCLQNTIFVVTVEHLYDFFVSCFCFSFLFPQSHWYDFQLTAWSKIYSLSPYCIFVLVHGMKRTQTIFLILYYIPVRTDMFENALHKREGGNSTKDHYPFFSITHWPGCTTL